MVRYINVKLFSFCFTECGKPAGKATPLIVGGSNITIGDSPWHVAIYLKDVSTGTVKYICGGSILNPKVVLSGMNTYKDFNRREKNNDKKEGSVAVKYCFR